MKHTLHLSGRWGSLIVYRFRNGLAVAYACRGNSKRDFGAVTEAYEDYGKAVKIMEGIREYLNEGQEWQIDFRHVLAVTYINWGNTKRDLGADTEALNNYDQAIVIMEGIRKYQRGGLEWTLQSREGLSAAYINRGVVKFRLGEFREATDDYGLAIGYLENIHALFGEGEVCTDASRFLLLSAYVFWEIAVQREGELLLADKYRKKAINEFALVGWETTTEEYHQYLQAMENWLAESEVQKKR